MLFASPPFIVSSRDGNHSFGAGAVDVAQALEKLDAMELAGFGNLTCTDAHGRRYSREELVDLAGARLRRAKRRGAPARRKAGAVVRT